MPVQVSNLAQHNLTLSAILRTQQSIFEREVQVSSGKQAQRYAGVADQATRLLNLKNATIKTDQFLANNTSVNLRLQLMESTLSNMFDLASDFRSQLVAALNSSRSGGAQPTSVVGSRTFATPATTEITAGANGYGTLTITVTGGGGVDGTLDLDLDTLRQELENDGVIGAGDPLTVTHVVNALNGVYGTGGASELTNPVEGLPQETATAQGGVSGDFAAIDADGFFRLAVLSPTGEQTYRLAIDDSATTFDNFDGESGFAEFFGFSTDQATAPAAADINLRTQAENALRGLANMVNVDLDGRYLFAGSRIDTLPWDVDAFLADSSIAFPPLDADADYSTAWYAGDSTTTQARLDASFTLDYGIAGNNQTFERFARALRAVVDSRDSTGAYRSDRLSGALELLNRVVKDLPDLRTQVGNGLKAIDDAGKTHADFKLYAEESISDIENVDVVDAINRLNADQAQIQASYLAVSRIRTLSLANFLR